jgi:hypothetical protein
MSEGSHRKSGGRPRTFPLGIIPIAMARRAKGESWKSIASDMGQNAGTLRARACEFHRVQTVHKTSARPIDTHW